MKIREFDVIVEKDNGWLIASVPALPGCYTQARAMNGLVKNIKEAIELHLESLNELKSKPRSKFVVVKKISVYA